MILYAATSNPGKLAEFQSAALAEGIAIEALPNLKQIPEPIEDASTFQGNADLKAIAYSLAAPGLLVFADDSGLEVSALNNRPGVRSARFADDLRFDLPSANNPSSSTPDQRNNSLLLRANGAVEGQLLHHPRGSDGFGYDPLFLIPSLNLTFAELPREHKWQLSHRGNAFRSLLAQLRDVRL